MPFFFLRVCREIDYKFGWSGDSICKDKKDMLLAFRSLTYSILGLLRERKKKPCVKCKKVYKDMKEIYFLDSMRELNALQVQQVQ